MRTTRVIRLSILASLFVATSFIASAQTPLQFVGVTPCRLVDTRPQNGGNGPIQGGTFQTFDLRQLAQAKGCHDLSSAAAYSLNVTVVPDGFLGYLTIWPASQPQPTVSTLNSTDGRVKANAAIVVAGTAGAVSVYVTDTTNVVLDIDGYFVSATESALAFFPLTPCRIADTRPVNGGAGPIPGGTIQNFEVQGFCGVPANATAYSLNFTAVPPGPLGFLTVWPAGGTQPMVSTLNDQTGTIVANAAILGAGTGMGGPVSVYPTDTTNLVIDVNGYFAAPGPGGFALYPLTNPCRVIDTRRVGDGMPFSGPLVVDVEGSPCAPSPLARAYVMNATVVPQGPLGYLTLWPNGPAQPVASTLNATDGLITTNMAIVPTSDGKIDAYASSATQLVLDLSSYFAPLSVLMVTTTSLPSGMINTPYSATLGATGGEPPYNWSLVQQGGPLPPGLGLGSDGSISGTPTTGGLYTFTVQVADTLTRTAFAVLKINIQTGSLAITTTTLPSGTKGEPYSATLGASGGTLPYIWSIDTGFLPQGLTLDSNTGVISGSPMHEGASDFTVKVTDSSSPPVMATAPLTININGAITDAALSGPYAFSFNGYNNPTPVFVAGNFIADGNGNITGGVLDSNSATGGPQNLTLTGTYSIQGNGLGTMTLTTTQGAFVFSVAISNKGISGTSRNGYLIQRDPANPTSYGSGVILVQNSLQFNLGAVVGNYAFGYSGIDPSSKRVAGAGAYTTTLSEDGLSVNLVNGMADTNDNGTPAGATFSPGTFTSAVDPTSGRGTATLTLAGGTVRNYVFYVVSAAQILMISSDPINQPANLTLWSIAQQHSSSFTNSSLNGVGVIEFSGTDVVGGSPVSEAEAGLLTTDGAGNGSVSIDQNDGGTLTQFTSSGTYTVAANGRVALSSSFQANPPILYLVDRNQAFVVGTDSLVTSGILDAQTSPPFSNVSILGQYLGGTVTPVLASVTNTAGAASGDGASPMGDITFSLSSSGPSGPGSSQPSGTYTIDGTGRGVLTLNGSAAGITYTVSPQKFVLLPNSSAPILSTFTRGSTN